MAIDIVAFDLIATLGYPTLIVTGVDAMGTAEDHRTVAVRLTIGALSLPCGIAEVERL